jgi:hypothetical protein
MNTIAKIEKSKVYVDPNGVMRGFKKPEKIYLEKFQDEKIYLEKFQDAEDTFARKWMVFAFFSFLIALILSLVIK